MWNPITWAYFLQKKEYLDLFYDTLPLHLTHALDVNPGKFDIESNEEGSYLNKGKLQALIFTIFNRDWDNFLFGWKAAHRYLSGWHVFSAFRAFVDF